MKQNLAFHKDKEENERQKLEEAEQTSVAKHEIDKKVLTRAKEVKDETLKNEESIQEQLNRIKDEKLSRERKEEEQTFEFEEKRSKLLTAEVKEQLEAIQPGLIEALISSNDVKLLDSLAKNIKEQKGVNGLAELFTSSGEGGFDGLMKAVKGTGLENRADRIIKDYKKMREERETSKKK